MTRENALFVVAGVGLMFLVEWARHHFEAWWNEHKMTTVLMWLGALLLLVLGAVVIAFALKMK